jgi:predicted RND superfamily exporter protein
MGVYLLTVGMSMVFQKKRFLEILDEMTNSRAMLYVLGFIAMLLGLLVVLTHHIWTGGFFPLVVTLMGWVMFLKGLTLLFVSTEETQLLMRVMKLEPFMWLYAVIAFVLGAYLTYGGFVG